MNQNGLHIDGTSLLHQVHPTVRIVMYGAYIAVMGVLPWQARLVSAFLVFCFLMVNGITPLRYKPMALMMLVLALAIPLWQGHFGHLDEGIVVASLILSQGMGTIVLLTVAPWELGEVLMQLRIPHRFGYFSSYLFQLMPKLWYRRLELQNTWRCQGVTFGGWSVIQQFLTEGKLLASLFILELFSMRIRSYSLESRGFSLYGSRPSLMILPPLTKTDKVVMVIAITVIVAILVTAAVIAVMGFSRIIQEMIK